MFPFFFSLSREIFVSALMSDRKPRSPLLISQDGRIEIRLCCGRAVDRGNLCLYPTPIGCCLILERLRFSVVFYDWAMILQQHNATAPRLGASFRSAFFIGPGTCLGPWEIRQSKQRREGKLAFSEGSQVLLVFVSKLLGQFAGCQSARPTDLMPMPTSSAALPQEHNNKLIHKKDTSQRGRESILILVSPSQNKFHKWEVYP